MQDHKIKTLPIEAKRSEKMQESVSLPLCTNSLILCFFYIYLAGKVNNPFHI